MPVHDELGLRIKNNYEKISQTKLMRRCPVMLRLDGKAFHSFTRGFNRPFDNILVESMQETMKYLCENIQGCVLGYTQSDEITLILIDYQKHTSQAWFDYRTDKMCSIAASMATMAFNKAFSKNIKRYDMEWKCSLTPQCVEIQARHYEYIETLTKAVEKGAMFDCRCFNIPKEEVTNCIYWRQVDATRNSIQMVGQANFSHKELDGKKQNDIQDMLMIQKGINWNDFPTHLKRGSCCIKTTTTITCATEIDGEVKTWATERPHWFVDMEIPIFKNEGREYIEKLINVDE